MGEKTKTGKLPTFDNLTKDQYSFLHFPSPIFSFNLMVDNWRLLSKFWLPNTFFTCHCNQNGHWFWENLAKELSDICQKQQEFLLLKWEPLRELAKNGHKIWEYLAKKLSDIPQQLQEFPLLKQETSQELAEY